ncbi:UBX domain-containing protein 1-like [Cucurbita pepo subsp. pepo]|uniref:UBX domain-containing protein 1-like n=1 Tax=Cucurbita pepo subsp. pepo TaxID=3664 RepID=UPI000C9D7824|nr:UBX domain-containing protein 1-like [Cucurbita pepo subsp. pepo]XP_023546174.1 UBX domain-containing protein 1-like [Cucurbita pepo subsp. pepo]XP_023546175.1 UBX domain-containing protein 1-like [Cucurbita pepo subsp. pepo]XP_023546176.1 UBX domain-containing protein 1-like [Cucurbita pepo subsp. pepo]
MAFLEVKQKLLREIEDLGFPRARVVRALHSTGNVSTEAAINWLIDHENDPDIDQMPLVAIEIDLESPEPFHITEEMKRKAKELRDHVRKEKEEEEKKLERQREKDRIRSGKELQEAKRTAEEAERKRYIDSRQADKQEEKRAREKVLQKLEQDKIERRRNSGMLSERSESLDTKSNATEAGKKDELRSQNSLPATSVSKAVSMRECLRSLRRHQKDDSDKVRTAYRTLFIYVRNVAKNPDEEKFRKIRLSNPLFQERVGSLKGGIEFLELCGFERGGEFLYLPRDKVDRGALVTAGSLLKSAMTNPFFGAI